jgi:Ku protein
LSARAQDLVGERPDVSFQLFAPGIASRTGSLEGAKRLFAVGPATTEKEKTHFHRINRKTGNRVRIQNVDEETREPVEREDMARGYEVSKGEYIEITDEEVEAVEVESTRTIEIDQFVPKNEIDQLYNIRPYYIAPDGEVGLQAFAVIRKAIEKENMVALGRVVLTSREHMIALEPRGQGIMGTLLRYPYEVRDEKDYFDEIGNVETPKDIGRSRLAHRPQQGWPLRSFEVRGPLRERPKGTPEAQGRR